MLEERWQAAERLAPGIYTARRSKLGAEHPDTVEALHLVIRILEALGSTVECARYRALLRDVEEGG